MGVDDPVIYENQGISISIKPPKKREFIDKFADFEVYRLLEAEPSPEMFDLLMRRFKYNLYKDEDSTLLTNDFIDVKKLTYYWQLCRRMIRFVGDKDNASLRHSYMEITKLALKAMFNYGLIL